MSRLAVHVARKSDDGRVLLTRRAAALLFKRHPDQISRHAQPVACDVKTRLPLYDLDAVEARLLTIRRRVA